MLVKLNCTKWYTNNRQIDTYLNIVKVFINLDHLYFDFIFFLMIQFFSDLRAQLKLNNDSCLIQLNNVQ